MPCWDHKKGQPLMRLAFFAVPYIPLHPQGTGDGIPPPGYAGPLMSALRASD